MLYPRLRDFFVAFLVVETGSRRMWSAATKTAFAARTAHCYCCRVIDTAAAGGEKYAVALRDFVYMSLKLVLGRDATPTRKTAGAAAIHGSTAAQGTSGAAPLAHADGAFATISSMGAVR